MSEAESETRRMIVEAGTLVILHPDGPAGGFPLVVSVDRVADGLHWFLGSCDPIGRGDTLIVETPIADDARYVTRGSVAACSPSTFALKLDPNWERVQQRAFVRVSAHGLQVRVIRLVDTYEPGGGVAAGFDDFGLAEPTSDATSPSRDSIYELLDLSAGGIRFRCEDDFERDEEVVCHFELPGSHCFVLPARIVRPSSAIDPRGKSSVAVEFVGLDENNRSQLLRWVYREQVRRHRDESRKEAKRAAREAEREKHRR